MAPTTTLPSGLATRYAGAPHTTGPYPEAELLDIVDHGHGVVGLVFRLERTTPICMVLTVSAMGAVMQAVLDNPFLLLFIGVAVPTVSYLIWGIIDIVLIPIGK